MLSTSGDTHLGGDDFDKRIVDFLADDFKQNEGIDLRKDRQVHRQHCLGRASRHLAQLKHIKLCLFLFCWLFWSIVCLFCWLLLSIDTGTGWCFGTVTTCYYVPMLLYLLQHQLQQVHFTSFEHALLLYFARASWYLLASVAKGWECSCLPRCIQSINSSCEQACACMQALQRLTEAAEKAKMELSSVAQTSISLPFITATADGPKHIESQMSRAKFESICSDLLDRCRIPVEQALKDAKLKLSDLNEVSRRQ